MKWVKNSRPTVVPEEDDEEFDWVEEATEEFLGSHTSFDAHILPVQQPWHTAKPWCYCVPELTEEHPLTGAKLWLHRVIVH